MIFIALGIGFGLYDPSRRSHRAYEKSLSLVSCLSCANAWWHVVRFSLMQMLLKVFSCRIHHDIEVQLCSPFYLPSMPDCGLRSEHGYMPSSSESPQSINSIWSNIWKLGVLANIIPAKPSFLLQISIQDGHHSKIINRIVPPWNYPTTINARMRIAPDRIERVVHWTWWERCSWDACVWDVACEIRLGGRGGDRELVVADQDAIVVGCATI